jgi:(E)-4-hydroxy-3-methylbut-2-enyl-diphosphate synthase
VKGRNVAVVPEAEMVDALVDWAEFIVAHGVDAAIARADTALAEREAERDRRRNLGERGDDANDAATRIELIQKKVGS